MRKSIRGAASLLLVLGSVVVLGCGSFASYRLPVSATQAPGTFAPLAACASQQSLTAVEHPTSVNVRFDPTTWIQYMIQGEQYNMVIIVNNDVPPDQRPAKTSSAKAKGDELWACAMSHGIQVVAVPVPVIVNPPTAPTPPTEPTPPATMSEPVAPTPPTALTPPTPPSPPTAIRPPAAPRAGLCRNARELAPRSACASARAAACTVDSQCPGNNCTRGFCQGRDPGSPCKDNANCNTNNCTGGCCHARDPGGYCTEDFQCNTNNCTNGMCQNRDAGSPCKDNANCNMNNCTNGCCQ